MDIVKRPVLITGIDIGATKISAVTAQADGAGSLTVLAHVTQPSAGISKGVFLDLHEATSSVSKVLKKLKEKLPNGLGDIYANISGETVKGVLSKGMIPISLRGREVTKADMNKCINVASTIHLPIDREIIHKVVHKFSVDDQTWIENPLGLYASRLSCEVYIITAGVNHIQNIYKCINNAGYDIKDVVFTGIADSEAVLSAEDRSNGAVLLDMGATLTNVIIFYGGAIQSIDVIPAGCRDISSNFQDSIALNEIISKTKSDISAFTGPAGNKPSIVLVGGITFTDGLVEFLEDKFAYPIKMGISKDVRGDLSGLDSMRLITALGLVKYAGQKHRARAAAKDLPKMISEKLIDIFNNYF